MLLLLGMQDIVLQLHTTESLINFLLIKNLFSDHSLFDSLLIRTLNIIKF